MKPSTLIPLVLFTDLTTAAILSKRCRVGRSITPCWIRWDFSECEAYRPVGVNYAIDKTANTITITGLCESCSRALALEKERDWPDSWGTESNPNWKVQDKGNGTFLLKGVSRDMLHFHEGLVVYPEEWGTSCVWVEGDD
ncbi:hypothetical protein V8F06_014055 [Rhypophila decipiens]